LFLNNVCQINIKNKTEHIILNISSLAHAGGCNTGGQVRIGRMSIKKIPVM
jgi:hypothetical protein